MRVPDYFEALTGYRCFDVLENGLLSGQHIKEVWPPYEAMQAKCLEMNNPDAHLEIKKGQYLPAPRINCTCGIYAFKNYKDVELRLFEYSHPYYDFTENSLPQVWGELAIWGRVIEHKEGYRAEYAYPKQLWCNNANVAKIVGRLYGVSCQFRKVETPQPKKDFVVYQYFTASGHMVGKGPLGVISQPTYPPSIYPMWESVMGVTDPHTAVQDITPMVEVKHAPTPIAHPSVVGANRWQARQYGRVLQPPPVSLASWRDILKLMVYKTI